MITIVAGTDLSEASARALLWAADLASTVDGRVIAVSALGPDAVATPAQIEEHLPIGEKLLAAELRRLDLDDQIIAGSIARFGDPRAVIAGVAHWHEADLVVVGSARGDGVGGVIQHLLHHAHCSVAVVPTGAPPLPGGTFVLGVDGSAANERALAWAVDMAGRVSGRVEAVYAYHPALGPAQFEWMEPARTAGVEERAARELVETLDSGGVPVTFRMINGPRAEVLTRHAAAVDAAAIVVGSRGRGSVAGRIVGRVPYQLLRSGTRPIVTVPGHDES